MALFALPFIATGIWAAWSITNSILDWQAMQGWQPVQATVTRGGVDDNWDGETTTYRAYADYSYSFNGQRYTAQRIGIEKMGGDNIGDYQQDWGARLAAAARSGASLTAYVDPADPVQAVLDRELRWGLVAFKAVFFLVFGGAGAAMLAGAVYSPKIRMPEGDVREQPWLANPHWQSAEILSNSKGSMYFATFFAFMWNGISAPLPFVIWHEFVEKKNPAAVIGLLFPLVGIGLAVWAVQRIREWKRFGHAPVTLDPFPAAIGGQAGGFIDINLPYDSAHTFFVTLSCIRSVYVRSGKNSSRRETVNWSADTVAYAEPGNSGTRLQFRFDVPAGLPPSDVRKSRDDYNLWRLSLRAALPGADIDRDYEIPAYPSTRKSHVPDRVVAAGAAEMARVAEREVRADIRLEGEDMFYPMGRHLLSSFIGILFGGFFAATGAFLAVAKGEWFGGAIFGGIGSLILLGCLYACGNSLRVKRDSLGSGIETTRCLFGIPVRRRYAAIDDIVALDRDSTSSTGSGGRQVKYYRVFARLRNGGEITLGESFQGEAAADAATIFVKQQLQLRL
ncbi:MAG TPA: DUF3592 domain-containing protein [Patescibacteria group bacterium]|nr:DUF3592 domain-containing protein [Patescibacteria group bacterium]